MSPLTAAHGLELGFSYGHLSPRRAHSLGGDIQSHGMHMGIFLVCQEERER
jgi:hypothetical protein